MSAILESKDLTTANPVLVANSPLVLTTVPSDNFEEYQFDEFIISADGLYINYEKKPIRFTSNFVEVVAIGCDCFSNQWSLVLEFKNFKDEYCTKIIPLSRLNDFSAITSELADKGFILDVGCEKHFRTYLTRASCSLKTPHFRLITKIGFFPLNPNEPEGAYGYALPNQTIVAPDYADDAPKVLFMPVVPSPTHAAYHAAGNIETYLTALEPAKNNPLWVFDFCVGLAAIIRELAGGENFGVNTHGQSSTGKSIGGQIAMSIIGCCADSQRSLKPTLRQSWVTTSNAMELMATAHSGFALFLDELGSMPAGSIVEIYALLQGQGKSRMSQYGTMQNRSAWSILVLSTGELSMQKQIQQEPNRKIKEGEMIRFLDIPVDNLPIDTNLTAEEREQLAITLKTFLSENYGVVGIKFIEAIIETFSTIAELKNGLNERIELCNKMLCDDLIQIRPYLSSVHRRAIRHFATIWASGRMAVEAEVSPFNKDDIDYALKVVARAWLEDFPLAENEQLLTKLKDYLNDKLSQIVNTDTEKASNYTTKKPNILLHDEKIWLSSTLFEDVYNDLNVLKITKVLYSIGVLHRSEGSDQYKTKVSIWPEVFGKSSRYYALHATKLFTIEEFQELKEFTQRAKTHRPTIAPMPTRRSLIAAKKQVIPVVECDDEEYQDVDYNNYEEDDAEPVDDEY